MAKKWDFSGWATKANLRCSDGRTIRKGAFKDCDGKTVPLVWNHQHDDPSEVLGHALLEDRDGDMYAYCSFNGTSKGQDAKELVKHGDVVALSIYANQLTQSSKNPPCDVIHGNIREVSLVLAGANPGAFIDNVLMHGELIEDEAEIFNGEDGNLVLYHSRKDEDEEDEIEVEDDEIDEEDSDESEESEEKSEDEEVVSKKKKKKEETLMEKLEHSDLEGELMSKVWGVDSLAHADEETVQDVFDTFSEKQKKAVYAVIGLALSKGGKADTKATVEHADEESDEDGETIKDIFDTLSEKQKKVAYAIIGAALENKDNSNDSEEEEDDDMKHNVFDTYEENNTEVLSHADMEQIFKDAKRLGSLKAAVEEAVDNGVLSHAVTDRNENEVTYGIADIDYLFPDAKTINTTPEFIHREMSWVDKVMNATHHTPFARVKSMFADITMDEARAKGYTKGKLKSEEVFSLLKRSTDPQTIYKKQKLDRDDILDITDFDVVAWLKGEMRLMLNEEIARAILIGDGRSGSSNDKIFEEHIRPVYNDADLYTVKVPVAAASGATDEEKAKKFINEVIRSRKLYKGSGNPTLFTTEDMLTEMLLLEDEIGHKLYKTEAELATTLRVKEIVTVEPMEGIQIGIKQEGGSTQNYPFIGVIVNLKDYNVGTNKGGQTSFFDDFDIDYNQQKYLLETRLSGALIKPYSALSFYETTTSSEGGH